MQGVETAPDGSELISPIGPGPTAPWSRRSPVLVGVHLARRHQAGEVRATIVAGRSWSGSTRTHGSVPGVGLGQGAHQ